MSKDCEPSQEDNRPEPISSLTDIGRLEKKAQYEVGYGKPPKARQFRPGRSGNPKGRRKRMPSVSEQIQALLRQKVTITEGGQRKRKSRQEVILTSIANNALRGDLKSANFLLGLQADHRQNTSDVIDPDKLSDEGLALLHEYTRQLRTGEEIDAGSDIEPHPRIGVVCSDSVLNQSISLGEAAATAVAPTTFACAQHNKIAAEPAVDVAPSLSSPPSSVAHPLEVPAGASGTPAATVGQTTAPGLTRSDITMPAQGTLQTPEVLPIHITAVTTTVAGPGPVPLLFSSGIRPVGPAVDATPNIVVRSNGGLLRKPNDPPFESQPTAANPGTSPSSLLNEPQPLATAHPEPWKRPDDR